MSENQIDVTVEFWTNQFKTINWSHEYSLNKKELIDHQSARQILCSRLGQTCLNKEQRKAIIESFKGEAREYVRDIVDRYALKD